MARRWQMFLILFWKVWQNFKRSWSGRLGVRAHGGGVVYSTRKLGIRVHSRYVALKRQNKRRQIIARQWIMFLRLFLMDRKILGDPSPGASGSPAPVAWAIAHVNLGIRRNSSFMAVKSQKMETIMARWWLMFLRSFFMGRQNFRLSGSGRSGTRRTRGL